MTTAEARELMNGQEVWSGKDRGEVVMPQKPTGWFTVRWERGTETRHEISASHSVAELETRS